MADTLNTDIAIIGGGICGLTTAWQLARAGQRVALLEKSDAPGGVVRTHREGDWLFECGPNSITFSEKDDIHRFLLELDLQDDLLMQPLRTFESYIWRTGLLRRVPARPLHLLRQNAVSRRTLSRMLPGLWRRYDPPSGDVSVGAFFSPLIGRQAVEQLLAPALAGIYAAHPFSLSFQAAMPHVFSLVKKHTNLRDVLRALRTAPVGSGREFLPAGNRNMASFTGGMSTLTQRLEKAIRDAGGEIVTGFEAKSVSRIEGTGWTITSAEGRTVAARKLVCCTPATAAARLLEKAAPATAGELRKFRYVPLVVAHVGARNTDVPVSCQGIGVLNARESDVRSLGILWTDHLFRHRAPADHRLFTVFIGGHIDPLACDLAATELLEIAFSDLKQIMQWQGAAAAASHLTYHKSAIPLFEVGHVKRTEDVRGALPPDLFLGGNYLSGVSLPACIRGSIQLAEQVSGKE